MNTTKNLIFIFLTLVVNFSCVSKSVDNKEIKVPVTPVNLEGTEVATFASGCFWCTEAIFERVEGVVNSVSGYTGGKEENPTYKQVSYGRTGHAEAVQVTYDPAVVTYAELLEIFFATHDPTQLNRQGPDVGKQYRSGVYYHNQEQKNQAEKYISKLDNSGKYSKPIVTEITRFTKFYVAEDYHQNYYEINPNQPYVYNVSRPKVEKLLKLFPDKIKKEYRK